jgi:hypothetical protein
METSFLGVRSRTVYHPQPRNFRAKKDHWYYVL